MTIIENPRELGDAASDTTVCVIGSGPAGAIVAVALANAGIDVVVLEAGSTQPDHRPLAALDRVDVYGHADLRFAFARQLGGATNLWSGRLAPMEPIDFETRAWVPGSGWPVTAAALAPYYARAAQVLGLLSHTPSGENHATPSSDLASPTLSVKVFQWATTPFKASEHLRATLAKTDRLRVVLNAPVTRLVEDENARSIREVVVALPGGGSASVRARYVVVAAGGLETPRLFLNSNAVRPAGVGNDHDAVGRYLSTHPKANMGSLILHRRVSTRHPLFCDWPRAGGVVRYGLGLDARVQEEHRLLDHYVQLLPLFEHAANRLFEKVKGSRSVQSPLVDRAPLIRGLLPGLGLVVFDAMGRIGGIQRRASKFVLRAFLDQYPNPDHRVTLSHATDEGGTRKVNIKWGFTDDDRKSVVDFFALMDRDIRARGLGRVDYGKLAATTPWPLTGLHSHFMGTTRMGEDRATSVTNSDCRVHGSDNLFVAGPSLFPTYGYANPVYTIAALSLRLADHLQAKLVKEKLA